MREYAANELLRVSQPFIDAVWPLYREGDRSPLEHLGSSVLLRAGEEWFLLSAAHVLNERRTRQVYLGLGQDLYELNSRFFSTSDEHGAPDLAVSFLETEFVQAAGNPGHVRAEDVLVVPQKIERTVHVVVGFPHTKQPKGPKKSGELPARPMTHAGHSMLHDKIRDLGYDPSIHVLIEFDKKASYRASGRGMPPHPYGLSGGGVWAVPDLLRISSPMARLAAIGIEWRRDLKCLVASRVQPCLALIARHRPELLPRLAPLLQ